MCSCKIKSGPKSFLQESGITNFISYKDYKAGETSALMQLLYCVGPNEVNEKLSVIKIDGQSLRLDSTQDAKNLGIIHDAKQDMKLWNIDTKALLLTIEFTPEQLQKSECSTGFYTDETK